MCPYASALWRYLHHNPLTSIFHGSSNDEDDNVEAEVFVSLPSLSLSTSMMASHVLAGALRADARLGDTLAQILPAHTLDAIAAASLGALGVAYLFPKWTWNKPDPYEFIYYERPQNNDGVGGANNITRNISKRLEELVNEHNPTFVCFKYQFN